MLATSFSTLLSPIGARIFDKSGKAPMHRQYDFQIIYYHYKIED